MRRRRRRHVDVPRFDGRRTGTFLLVVVAVAFLVVHVLRLLLVVAALQQIRQSVRPRTEHPRQDRLAHVLQAVSVLVRERRTVHVVRYEAQDIGTHARVVHHERQLRPRRQARQTRIHRQPALLLRRDERLDLMDERLGRDGLLVSALEVDALVVERLVKVARVDFAPHLVPLALRPLPLLVLLLEARQHDRHSDARVVVQRSNHLEAVLPAIHLFHDALVNALALAAQSRLETERRALLRIHRRDPRGDRLEQRNRAQIRLDMVVVLVPLLLAAIQRVLVHILLVRIERLALTRPGGIAHPPIVQHLPAQGVAATARQVDLALRQLAVRRATRLLHRQVKALALERRHIVQHGILILQPAVPAHVVPDEPLEHAQQLRAAAQEQRGSIHERRHINHVLRIQVEQL